MTSRHFTLRQPECNLPGSDVTSPLTPGSQHKPYGHHGCYLVEKVVLNILMKGHGRKFDKERMQFIDTSLLFPLELLFGIIYFKI